MANEEVKNIMQSIWTNDAIQVKQNFDLAMKQAVAQKLEVKKTEIAKEISDKLNQ